MRASRCSASRFSSSASLATIASWRSRARSFPRRRAPHTAPRRRRTCADETRRSVRSPAAMNSGLRRRSQAELRLRSSRASATGPQRVGQACRLAGSCSRAAEICIRRSAAAWRLDVLQHATMMRCGIRATCACTRWFCPAWLLCPIITLQRTLFRITTSLLSLRGRYCIATMDLRFPGVRERDND